MNKYVHYEPALSLFHQAFSVISMVRIPFGTVKSTLGSLESNTFEILGIISGPDEFETQVRGEFELQSGIHRTVST